jgi:predicted N-formylglutamate amidohydrolase
LIEKHAKATGVTTITIEVANAGIEQAKETMELAMKNPGQMDDLVKNIMGSVKR